MTEAEWMACVDPPPMLEYLVGRAGDRKFRLFAVECCRRVQEHISDPRCRQALAILEENVGTDRYAPCFELAASNARAVWHERHYRVLASSVGDDLARRAAATSTGTLTGLTDDATARAATAKAESDPIVRAASAVWVAAGAGSPTENEDFASYRAEIAAEHAARACGNEGIEKLHQVRLLRDIFGNPFLPVPVDPRWLTETTATLATGIYADRAFDRMPILADALEEAGCDNRDMLDHCRGDGPHVRGCWVVDLLLGKV